MFSLFLIIMQICVLAYALVGGVFLAFSDFIMRSLAKTGDTGGVETMQSINREVFHWVTMTLFLGMAGVSLIVIGYSVVYLGGVPGALFLAAGAMYLIGCYGVTVLFNVPMNEKLAGMDRTDAAARAYWTGTYLPRWTAWNTVRTVACILSAGLLMTGLVWMAQAGAVAG